MVRKAKSRSKPTVHTFSKKAKAPKEDETAKAKSARDEDVKHRAKAPEPPKRGLIGRLAAASASEEVTVASKPKASGGVDWEDWDDDEAPSPPPAKPSRAEEPVIVAKKPAPVAEADGIQVVAKGAGKFSMADIEALKSAIKIKGSTSVVEGINLDELKWDAEGLIPVLAQDRRTGAALGLNWCNREGLEASLRKKTMTYYSKRLGKPVVMDEPGRHQRLVTMKVDCDKDALLALVDQEGPACHNDTGTCWTTGRLPLLASYLGELDRYVAEHAKLDDDEYLSKAMAEPLRALKAFVDDANLVTKTVQGKSEERLDDAVGQLLENLIVVMRTQGMPFEKAVTSLYARRMAAELQRGKS